MTAAWRLDDEETVTGVAAPELPTDDVTRRVRRASAPLIAGERYQIGPVIGAGGMGEVVTAHDTQIGRDVAIKRLRSKTPTRVALARFLREARIQGRLEHPAIPPVHELDHDEDGRPYFVMKKLSGVTLSHAIQDPERFPRQRLLRAFVEVCNAIELAHSRRVVHRDVKPANVLVGDLGEVYVLDWGIARELDSPDHVRAAETGGHVTGCVGTPGYMAPEQILEAPDVDARADVYALGCVLFEILAGEPLHPKGDAGLRSALGGCDARPSRRAAVDVPPELDELCVLATAPERTDRIGTARLLGDAVQRYLDGDRDLTLRSRLAREHLAAAQLALALGDGEESRRTAMREAGRSLALDPSASGAAELVGRLMIEPPKDTPRAVLEELETESEQQGRRQARIGMAVHGGYFLVALMLLAFGIRDPLYLGGLAGLALLNIALALAGTQNRAWPLVMTIILTNVLIIAVFSRMFSPFLVAPGVGAVSLMAFGFHPAASTGRAFAIVGTAALLAVLGPWFAELAGLVPPTTVFHADGGITMRSTMAGLAHLPVEWLVGAFVTALFVVAGGLGFAMARSERRLRSHLRVQAWQLRQLLSVPGQL